MKLRVLHILDDKNYNPDWRRYFREAVRVVIIKDKRIALVKSKTEGFFKFPGGGIEHGESHLNAIIRETQEETGLHIIPQSVVELGMVWELRKGACAEEIFEQKSYHYYADIEDTVTAQNLSELEKELAFELTWTDIETAYNINTELGKASEKTYLLREAYVLKHLLDLQGN
ncbi:MAG: NUDIX domain-containing protein [Oscillospiraceae bacterium]|nr:NUDIX domain-containing protein [Oscillospiraceae bacterium]